MRALWAAAAPADDSPGRGYLAWRRAWPPAGTGPNLPASVRWLAREAAPARDVAARWYGLPAGACGTLVFAYRPLLPAPESLPAALSLLAVSAAGERVTWFGERAVKVRTVGSRTGLVFTARPGPAGEPLHVAEGEVTALTLASWCGPGAVVAAGGTSGLRNVELSRCFHTVNVWADRDAGGDGQLAAAALAERLQAERRKVEIQLPPFLGDWNDVLMKAREAS